MIDHGTEVVEFRTIEAMVAAWTAAEAEIRQAYDLLACAEQRLERAFQSDHHRFALNLLHFTDVGAEAADRVIEEARRTALLRIIDKMGLRQKVSQKRWEAMQRQIMDGPAGDLPGINTEAIEGLVSGTGASLGVYFLELAQEAYAFLRPRRRDFGVGALKTNSKAEWGLGEKVILHVGMRHGYGRNWDVGHHFTNELSGVDRLFHWLDGKQIAGTYASPLLDAIRLTPVTQNAGETEYFAFRMFANGNIHLRMKRPDLVKAFNQAVANHDLPSRDAFDGDDSNLPVTRSA